MGEGVVGELLATAGVDMKTACRGVMGGAFFSARAKKMVARASRWCCIRRSGGETPAPRNKEDVGSPTILAKNVRNVFGLWVSINRGVARGDRADCCVVPQVATERSVTRQPRRISLVTASKSKGYAVRAACENEPMRTHCKPLARTDHPPFMSATRGCGDSYGVLREKSEAIESVARRCAQERLGEKVVIPAHPSNNHPTMGDGEADSTIGDDP